MQIKTTGHKVQVTIEGPEESTTLERLAGLVAMITDHMAERRLGPLHRGQEASHG